MLNRHNQEVFPLDYVLSKLNELIKFN